MGGVMRNSPAGLAWGIGFKGEREEKGEKERREREGKRREEGSDGNVDGGEVRQTDNARHWTLERAVEPNSALWVPCQECPQRYLYLIQRPASTVLA
jgi:hypothetical protein